MFVMEGGTEARGTPGQKSIHHTVCPTIDSLHYMSFLFLAPLTYLRNGFEGI